MNRESIFEELKIVLHSELTIHNNLIKIAEKMNEAIKQKQVEEVQTLTGQYDEYLGQIELQEQKRQQICTNLVQKTATQENPLNLVGIIKSIPQEYQKSFQLVREALKKSISQLFKINTSNQILLNESLLAIKNKFSLVTQFQNKLSGYQGNGSVANDQIRRNIVNQIA